ncbi:MAG: hypothetical protein Q8S84_02015 [bacterium]|nr:hypothetical protein [bacterium]MDP3380331.1 hypothetical protein [bacterium]
MCTMVLIPPPAGTPFGKGRKKIKSKKRIYFFPFQGKSRRGWVKQFLLFFLLILPCLI